MKKSKNKKRDVRLFIAIVLLAISMIAESIQAWILNLYIDAVIFNNWNYFSKTFSVRPPASGPDAYCLDRCVSELPLIAGWIGIVSFFLGGAVLVYSWLKPAHPLNGHMIPKPQILATDSGFAIVTAKGIDALSPDEVSAIFAYKIDELTTDLVCCDIVTNAGDGEQIRTIHEELSGFDAVMTRFGTLPGFNRQWRDQVILPPFATNRTIVYKRIGNA